MEYFDVVDESGSPTGERVSRADAHRLGVRHRTAHIWVVRREQGEIQVLLQKRAAGKDSFPGCYDTSAAGHIQAGDEPLPSALRELQEELGIEAKPEQLCFLGTFPIDYEMEFYGKPFRDSEISFVYVYDQPVETDCLHLQAEEVERVDWFSVETVADAVAEPRDPRFCVPRDGFRLIEKWCSCTK